jgi:hypothetical protein
MAVELDWRESSLATRRKYFLALCLYHYPSRLLKTTSLLIYPALECPALKQRGLRRGSTYSEYYYLTHEDRAISYGV